LEVELFSVVMLGHHLETGEEVAIKIVTKSETDDEEMSNEISVMAAVNHPNTVRYIEMFVDRDDYYVVLERISGGELFDKIIELSVYEETEAANAIRQALDAINYMHERGYVHRDLKPENLLLSSKDPDAQIKIADFGFATKIEGQLSEYLGTPPYMAPELVILYDESINGSYGKPVDMWALGCILYILLSGLHPFQMDDEEEMIDLIASGELEWLGDGWDNVSEGAKDLVSKMICADPNTRITASEALQHPWISELGSKNVLNVQDALRRFQLRKKFKGVVFSVMAGNRLKRSFKVDTSKN